MATLLGVLGNPGVNTDLTVQAKLGLWWKIGTVTITDIQGPDEITVRIAPSSFIGKFVPGFSDTHTVNLKKENGYLTIITPNLDHSDANFFDERCIVRKDAVTSFRAKWETFPMCKVDISRNGTRTEAQTKGFNTNGEVRLS